MSDVYFGSTQMQLNHEEFEKQAEERQKLTKLLDSLSQYRQQTPSASLKVAKAHKKRTTKRIKSINSHVSAQYKTPSATNDDILDFFLKRKHNMTSILEGVEDLESGFTTEDQPRFSGHSEHPSSQLFTQDEWYRILGKIKLRFPHLSAKTRKSLKYVTTKLDHLKRSEAAHLPQIWTQAASLPDDEMINEDIKWLYELDDEQMDGGSSFCAEDDSDRKLFVMTLSQALGEKHEGEYLQVEIILDSSPEPTQLESVAPPQDDRIPKSGGAEERYENTTNEELGTEQHESERFKDEQQQEIVDPSQLPTQLLDSQENRGYSSYEVLSLFPLESHPKGPKSTIQKQASILVPECPLPATLDEQIILSSSPAKNSETFQTPKKYRQDSVRSSPLLGKLARIMVSPLKLVLPDRLEVTQSAYSTARSSPTKPRQTASRKVFDSTMPLRKRFRTSRVKIAGNLHLKTSDELKVVERFADGTESEIEDSEDEQSISIIEITHEIEDEDKLNNEAEVAVIPDSDDFFSIIQVPSSPTAETAFYEPAKQESVASVTQEISGTFTATQMRQALRQLELPAERTKEAMALLLTRAASVAGTTLLLLLEDGAPYGHFQRQIFQAISHEIARNQVWHERVISYEPIVLEELQQWLGEKNSELSFEPSFLQHFCDHMGITTMAGTAGTTDIAEQEGEEE